MIQEIIRRIDHTNLKPNATEADIISFVETAIGTGVASVCIAPCFVDMLSTRFGQQIPICTVAGFPNGDQSVEEKAFSVAQSYAHGACEVDYVVPLRYIKAGNYIKLHDEFSRVLREKPENSVFKVILETGALQENEIVLAIQTLNDLPIDFYKTSTGFNFAGASVEAAKIIMQHKRSDIRLKVSGGIATIEEAKKYIEIGADRIGASRLLAACLEKME